MITARDQTTEHFRVHGWMRVPEAFDSAEAAAMRDVVWHGLAEVGVQRDAPETWTIERPVKLQKLKDHPAFNAVGSARLRAASRLQNDDRTSAVAANLGHPASSLQPSAASSRPGARVSLDRDQDRAARARPAPDAAGPVRARSGRPFGGCGGPLTPTRLSPAACSSHHKQPD